MFSKRAITLGAMGLIRSAALSAMLAVGILPALAANGKSPANKALVPTEGTVLIEAENKDKTLESPYAKVLVKKGSVVYVLKSLRHLCVYNLHSVQNSVEVKLPDGRSVEVEEGKELLITPAGNATFDQLQPTRKIFAKNPSELNVGAGFMGFIADFEVGSAVAAIPSLRQKLLSPSHDDQELMAKILKVPVEMISLTAKPGGLGLQSEHNLTNLVLCKDEETRIKTDFGQLVCGAGTVVFTCQSSNSLAIFVVYEKRKGDVAVIIGERHLKLRLAYNE